MPLEGGEKNRAYGNRAKNISVNDQSSNSIENYVNSVYSVKWHINILLYCSLIDSSFNSSHFENIYIYCLWKKNSRNKR